MRSWAQALKTTTVEFEDSPTNICLFLALPVAHGSLRTGLPGIESLFDCYALSSRMASIRHQATQRNIRSYLREAELVIARTKL